MTKNSFKNQFYRVWNSPTITTWSSFLTKSLQIILVLPIVLNKFTVNDINLWYFVTALISLQVILDAGFGSAFVRIIAYTHISSHISNENEYQQEWDIKEQYNIYSFMKRVYLILFLISILLLLILGSFLMFPIINESSTPSLGWITWGCYVLLFPVVLFGNIYINFLQGIHKIYVLRRWDTLFNLLNVTSSIILVIKFESIYALLVSNLFWMVMAVIRNKKLVDKIFQVHFPIVKNTDYNFSGYSATIVYPAIKSGLGLIMSQGTIQLSGFVLNSFFGAKEISTYMLGLTLINAIRNFSQAPFYSKIPIYNSYTKKKDFDRLRNETKRSMKMVFWFFLIGFFTLAFFNKFFLELINSKSSFPSEVLWYWFGLAFLVDRYGGMHMQIYSTTNHIIWHKLNGITGAAMILLTIIMIKLDFGILSFPISMFVSYTIFYSFLAARKSYKLLNTDFIKFEKSVFLPVIIIFIIYGVYIYLN